MPAARPKGSNIALIRPFLPAKDFDVSKAFYQAIGFTIGYQDAELAIMDHEGAGFLLQKYYVEDWAHNTMLQLFVPDLDTWWQRTATLVETFGVKMPRAPTIQPWGLRVGFLFDPAGVLWQVSETIEDAQP